MTVGSRLYHLKTWLTLEDAASHLSTLLSERVKPQDILQLGLEKRLTLSVLLGPTGAVKGEAVSLEDAPVALPSPGNLSVLGVVTYSEIERKAAKYFGSKLVDIFSSHPDIKEAVDKGELIVWPLVRKLPNGMYITWPGDVVEVDGLWDLPMLSAERGNVLELLHDLVGSPKLDPWELDGVWVERDGQIFCLQQRRFVADDHEILSLEEYIGWDNRHARPDNWYPMDSLPGDSKIVVRRKNLDAFISSLDDQEPGQPADGGDFRSLEAFGLLVELYASQHGPNYQHGARPKASRIVQDMLVAVPDDVTNMGDRKLKEHVGAAIKAWEAKKRR